MPDGSGAADARGGGEQVGRGAPLGRVRHRHAAPCARGRREVLRRGGGGGGEGGGGAGECRATVPALHHAAERERRRAGAHGGAPALGHGGARRRQLPRRGQRRRRAQEWVEAIRGAGLCEADDIGGQKLEKLAPKIDEPVYLRKDDCFVAAFPSSQTHITYGIDFPKAPAIGCQWFDTFLDADVYSSKIAPARTFCIFEEVEKMRGAGLIRGGSLENAMVCSMTGGWLNPPLRFDDEPCRHKVLDLIGDFSLLAQNGSQGFPIAHVVAYKAGHALHTSFLRHLSGMADVDQGTLA
ncbi:probable UDP-3-O-acyl-N-acetylglucosamine deacetylase 1, mitochondrial isoform X3 [Hordeum vulgare subsp. vulgare]|uniref:probable UDP-3-O-acyl-N-acetylglucosamine deacetylase 1, mitochondrial isoform X3 n=1 Tax=Hordeum vulgare subsp. vulgare TaxID=112509 RepID=UPI001D1A3C17|nr:probable UDP-3-O-acyl-N-acetylglucosamine deacetylase 1, mitochondrial isoform X3 [Hordeum vulgare subsp. vulgare]